MIININCTLLFFVVLLMGLGYEISNGTTLITPTKVVHLVKSGQLNFLFDWFFEAWNDVYGAAAIAMNYFHGVLK